MIEKQSCSSRAGPQGRTHQRPTQSSTCKGGWPLSSSRAPDAGALPCETLASVRTPVPYPTPVEVVPHPGPSSGLRPGTSILYVWGGSACPSERLSVLLGTRPPESTSSSFITLCSHPRPVMIEGMWFSHLGHHVARSISLGKAREQRLSQACHLSHPWVVMPGALPSASACVELLCLLNTVRQPQNQHFTLTSSLCRNPSVPTGTTSRSWLYQKYR